MGAPDRPAVAERLATSLDALSTERRREALDAAWAQSRDTAQSGVSRARSALWPIPTRMTAPLRRVKRTALRRMEAQRGAGAGTSPSVMISMYGRDSVKNAIPMRMRPIPFAMVPGIPRFPR